MKRGKERERGRERGREGGEEEIPFISVLILSLISLPIPTRYPALLDEVTVSTSVRDWQRSAVEVLCINRKGRKEGKKKQNAFCIPSSSKFLLSLGLFNLALNN